MDLSEPVIYIRNILSCENIWIFPRSLYAPKEIMLLNSMLCARLAQDYDSFQKITQTGIWKQTEQD